MSPSDKSEVTKQLSPEMEQAAAQRARDRANAAKWDLDVAVFLSAVLIIVIILQSQGIEIQVVVPAAIFGLAMGWLMGWTKEKQLYEHFYDEEIARGEIVVMCAWCGKEMYRKLSLGQSVVSHGICVECRDKHFPKSVTRKQSVMGSNPITRSKNDPL